MAKLQEITRYINEYLQIDQFDDQSWNGLQVEGKEEVKKIITAVDADITTFNKAIKEKADMLLVHHGLFWKTTNPQLVSWQKERIQLLLDNNISLGTYHLPLDKHETVGNNIQILNIINAKAVNDFAEIGYTGKLENTKQLSEIEETLTKKLNTKLTTLEFGSKTITTVAVISGGGSYENFHEALDKKVDLYISGDPVYIDSIAKDAKINVIFAGHYATETVGVKALGKHLEDVFHIKSSFV